MNSNSEDSRAAGPSRRKAGISASLPQDHRTPEPSRHKVEISASLRQDCKTKYSRNSRTISGRLHDELVMMDIEQGKYFSLNPVATRIWDLLEKPLTEDELCMILIDEYDVEPERCLLEVSEHLKDMLRMGLILGKEI